MRDAIHKYDLYPAVAGVVSVEMPVDAKILCVQVQRDVPRIWAQVDTLHSDTEVRRFRLVETGKLFDGVGTYIGTVLVLGERYVLHVFEV